MPVLPKLSMPNEMLEPVQCEVPGRPGVINHLSRLATALVVIAEDPTQNHLLHRGDDDTRHTELWPADESGIIEELFEKSYPQLTFPTWSMYRFWRKGKSATREEVWEGYGFREESWLDRTIGDTGVLREFTAFNAMLRHFGDNKEAEHLEIRTPVQSIPTGRVPMDEALRLLEPPEAPPRTHQYASLWLPNLDMDKVALQWFGTWQLLMAKERQAEQKAADDEHINQFLKSVLEGLEPGDAA